MADALELVVWRDAHFSLDDENSDEDFLVETVGWTEPDGRFLRVESEHLPDDRGARSVTRIPLGMVVFRHPLQRADVQRIDQVRPDEVRTKGVAARD